MPRSAARCQPHHQSDQSPHASTLTHLKPRHGRSKALFAQFKIWHRLPRHRSTISTSRRPTVHMQEAEPAVLTAWGATAISLNLSDAKAISPGRVRWVFLVEKAKSDQSHPLHNSGVVEFSARDLAFDLVCWLARLSWQFIGEELSVARS
jgi:hypothetical protein